MMLAVRIKAFLNKVKVGVRAQGGCRHQGSGLQGVWAVLAVRIKAFLDKGTVGFSLSGVKGFRRGGICWE